MSRVVSPLHAVAARVGLAPTNPRLVTALTHSSFAAEHGVESNELLEFLGDAVVDLAVADLIVTRYPHLNEGSGSLVRSRVVNEATLADVARRLELGDALRVGRGVKKEEGARRPSLLADVFEAVVAAIYLERGYDAAKSFLHDELASEVEAASRRPSDVDPKTLLRQWTETTGRGTPRYEVAAQGPSHDVTFVATVLVAGKPVASGYGSSKKAAEVHAAQAALAIRAGDDA